MCGSLVINNWSKNVGVIGYLHLAAFVLLMIPKSYISLGRSSPQYVDSAVSISVVLSPLLLFVLMVSHCLLTVEENLDGQLR